MSGRKRHALVDTQGLLLKVVVSAANVSDARGARLIAHALRRDGPVLPRLGYVWADAAYGGSLLKDLREQMGWTLEIVKRSQTQPKRTFAVQPRRWVVERTFAWWGGFRRFSKDYEYQVESSEALIYAAMTHLMLRRLARSPVPSSSTG